VINVLAARLSAQQRNLILFAIASFMVAAAGVSAYFYDYQNDWVTTFQPAAQLMLHGQLNSAESGIFNPPWAMVLIAPFSVIPARIGSALIAAMTVAAWLLAARKMQASPLSLGLVLLMPHFRTMVYTSNLDWLVMLGLAVSPAWGLPMVLAKPQAGLAVAAFWIIKARKEGGLWKVAELLQPLIVCTVMAWLIGGPQLFNLSFGSITSVPWNQSFFPWSVLPGLLLLGWAIYKDKQKMAVLAGPMLAPYVGYYSWPVAALGVASSPYDNLVLVVFLMITYVTMHIGHY
jgi:hypothetical protein